MINRKTLIIAGASAFVAVFAGELLTLFILGSRFEGYNHIRDTMSNLGSSASPVSGIISGWWIIMGILMIVFAAGFRAAYSPGNKYVRIVFWLLVIYGLGEGIGSGIFKADMADKKMTMSFLIHDILGAAGILAVVILPYATRKIDQFSISRCFRIFSHIILVLGLILLILFSFRYLARINLKSVFIDRLADTMGIWQRLMILVYYIYMSAIAFRMMKISSTSDN